MAPARQAFAFLKDKSVLTFCLSIQRIIFNAPKLLYIMPFNNLNSVHLTPAEINKVDTALNDLDHAFANINVTLTPKERQEYGSINEQNKLLVNKTADFYRSQPGLGDPDVDWAEFQRDYQSRALYEGYINRLQGFIDRLNNAKTLHDYDNYQASLRDYDHTSYNAGRGVASYESKKAELRQFFTRTRSGNANNTPGSGGNVPGGSGNTPGGSGSNPGGVGNIPGPLPIP